MQFKTVKLTAELKRELSKAGTPQYNPRRVNQLIKQISGKLPLALSPAHLELEARCFPVINKPKRSKQI